MNYPPKTLLEQQCMTFCAIMKAMEGHLTEHNILSTCDKVWHWTKFTLASELAETNGPLEPPPDPPVEIEHPRPDGLESRKILVYDLKVKTGTNKNKKPYTRYAVTDEGGMEYTTFNKSCGEQFEVGKSYGIVFRFKQDDSYTSREIVEVTPLPALEDEIPF